MVHALATQAARLKLLRKREQDLATNRAAISITAHHEKHVCIIMARNDSVPRAWTFKTTCTSDSPPHNAAAQTGVPLVHLDATSYSLQCAINVSLGSLVEDEASAEFDALREADTADG